MGSIVGTAVLDAGYVKAAVAAEAGGRRGRAGIQAHGAGDNLEHRTGVVQGGQALVFPLCVPDHALHRAVLVVVNDPIRQNLVQRIVLFGHLRTGYAQAAVQKALLLLAEGALRVQNGL